MLKSTLTGLMLSLLLLVGGSSFNYATDSNQVAEPQKETVEKLIAINGNATINLDLSKLSGATASTDKSGTIHFSIAPDSFFTIIVNNNVFRAALPGAIPLVPQDAANLPAPLSTALQHLVLNRRPSDEAFEFVLRDARSSFVYFNIEGHEYDYNADSNSFTVREGRLSVSKDFAQQLGLTAEGNVVGTITLTANMQPVEIQTLVNGQVQSAVLPPVRQQSSGTPNVPELVAGPDVIVGDLPSITQAGSSGTNVGLGVGTTSCNNGTVPLDWFALSQIDHPVIPQNLYRMSANQDRFEQIGQSWLKHAFTALENDACGFGCNTSGCATDTHLCPGCSDPYDASLNAQQSGLGSRAWVNPFTGAYPSTAASHTGHTHTGTSHRVTVAQSDLSTAANPGATYFAEGQYVTPHEYAWCQANSTQCNMYNNVSYCQFSVTGTTSFTFGSIGSTVRMTPAIMAWTGASVSEMEPAKGADGIGFVATKVTNPSAGVWHYEYAVYNENLDRAIQSFSVPLGAGVVISNVAFHAPTQEPGWANDGTVGNTGFSGTPWTPTQTSSAITWASETFAQNQNANAIRWGTLYNFRFDANRAPSDDKALVGFFKTGSPINVGIKIPTGDAASPTPSPAPTATPTPTPSPTDSPSPTPSSATISLPIASVDISTTNFTQPVSAANINASSNLIGFQGDFTFDETVVTFQIPPVAGAGMTASGWTVAGNVIPGTGPIRTLRVSAFSNDGETPLSGSGTLYNLNMTRVSGTPGANTPLVWAASPNNFVILDTNLALVNPNNTPSGSITITAPASVSISGNVDYCSNPGLTAVPGVTMTLTGSSSGSTLTDGSGNYTFSSVTAGGTYTVTPSKAPLTPGSAGITTVDVVAVQRHFLGVTIIPAGCRLSAADVNGDSNVTTVDVIAIQRFFLGLTTGTANVGKYSFNPTNRSYPGISGNQTAQNYDTIVFGDVASSFVHRSESAPSIDGAGELPPSIVAVALPAIGADQSRNNFGAAVTTTAIDATSKLVGFQADLTFDERLVHFESDPVRQAGLTSGNWNVAGNVLPGAGPIRTLRISGYSTDFAPLTGEGTLFELRFARVNHRTGTTPLIQAGSPNQFLFIDADLNVQRPGRVITANAVR